jgi:hypothetical protein
MSDMTGATIHATAFDARFLRKCEAADGMGARLRLAKPALGRGRLQIQVRRAFIAADAPAISATEIFD